ncbi:MAG: hypothetical protein M0T77_00590 [Actinomycetota bacterium]|nr:hypothetical protein [Actinomycetota bacterium]
MQQRESLHARAKPQVRQRQQRGSRLVVVDAVDERAAAFYRRCGFIGVPEKRHRTFGKSSDIRNSFG